MDLDPQDYLESLSTLSDKGIDLALASVMLAAVMQPGLSLERYCNHLKKICEEVSQRYDELVKAGAVSDNGTCLAALKHILVDVHGYTGDHENYDDLQSASLIRVIERRKGMPIALAILYIHAAGAQGWDIVGLDIPGHFVCRLQQGGDQLIFDPFNDCKILSAPDLRELVKKTLGENAELSSGYFNPAGNRQILIQLQNNIKYRQIDSEDYEGALQTVEIMQIIDPSEYRLLLDAGVLYARTDNPKAAIDALEGYIRQAPHDRDRHEASVLLQELKEDLH